MVGSNLVLSHRLCSNTLSWYDFHPGWIHVFWGNHKVQAVLNSSMVFTFCWTLSNFCMCIQAHFQPGLCEQLGPSLASSDVWRSLWRSFCSFLSTQISLVNFWLVCWFAACPNQDHNLRLVKPLVVSVCHQHHYCYWHCCWAWVFSMLHSKSVSHLWQPSCWLPWSVPPCRN